MLAKYGLGIGLLLMGIGFVAGGLVPSLVVGVFLIVGSIGLLIDK